MAGIKDSKAARFFYDMPGAASTYHYLWAWAGAMRHGKPRGRVTVIGITGTKGKTTTLELLNAMLEAAGKRTALLSSLRVKIDTESKKNPSGNSMPGRAYLQRFLSLAARAGCEYALIEVTSQGVVQHRHRFVDWNIGALTNLSPEHIESHGSFENYRDAKLSFLKYVMQRGGRIVLNRDDEHFGYFARALAASAPIGASKADKETVAHVEMVRKNAKDGERHFLMSEFNAANAALAGAIARELGVKDDAIARAVANFKGVPGRAEFVVVDGYTGVVDYAHTPDSLDAIYKAVKPAPSKEHPRPRLICVLGAAGGGRDRWKRPAMGAIAAGYCDEIYLTNEDPYDEDPEAILNEVKRGIDEAGGTDKVRRLIDRREAIAAAVESMKKGDVVVGTGKGSEDWIHIEKGGKLPWNERGVFEEMLHKKKKA